ncbi:MgtC/SapB family protein [Clostridium sp. CCUG 7971]|uniref:MgtC/SapB family protein n=1 Tax=Clostridium sp. CCUG 7971 TaxID=2811414 RepID=UPI001ABBD6AC|nr:MgtC/SapB family protein [Clostridium sp. CCUG 7971]MBO3445267.1 MgtC/SapB family protein [Clostridium sp. CCUG 7971]
MEELIALQEHIPKLILAAIIGGGIGIERSNRGEGIVGFGTLSTLTVGCTLLTVLSAYGIGHEADPSRLISTIISSIGFIGGGVIFTQRNENEELVRGLTTASIIFSLAAIGVTIGLGYYGLAVITAVLIEINIIISKIIKKNRNNSDSEDIDDFE